jgi:hypothetical protein
LAPEREPSSSAQSSRGPQGLLYILVSAFASWFGWSLSKVKTPNENSGEPVPPQDTPNNPHDPTPRNATIVPNIPPSPANSNNANRSQKKAPLWEKLAAAAVAIGTIGLLVVNIFLLSSTQRQLTSFENSQRGQLTIENFSYVPDDPHVHYELWNRGNSIIRDIGERGPTGIGFEWVTFGEGGMADLVKKWRSMVKSDWRGYSIPAGQHRDYDVPAPTQAERRTHVSPGPSQDMLFFGRIYAGIDIFGHEQSAVICVQSFKGGLTLCRINPEQ